jgi:DNA-binding transcriptional LysR family regulator
MQNGAMFDWGDLKFFLATVKGGSTLAAARQLGVNQTTVARRLAALEEALSVRLFDRKQDGYRLTETGSAILAQAERVAGEAETLERLVAQRRRHLSGTIRVTTPELIANLMLTPWLSEFMELYPDIRVDILATDERLELGRGQADVALRVGNMPAEAGLVVRKLADAPWAIYCGKTYAEKHGSPSSVGELRAHVIIGAEGLLMKAGPYIWLGDVTRGARVRSVCSTIANVLSAVKAGQGVAALPCSVAHPETDLVSCFELPQFQYAYYLATLESLRDVPRIRAFLDFLVARAGTLKHVMEGRPA